MPQLRRNSVVVLETNSGSPSEASSSGMPKVEKVFRRVSIRPLAPSLVRSTIGQLE